MKFFPTSRKAIIACAGALLIICAAGCSGLSSLQPVSRAKAGEDNYIPGIEFEESGSKLLVSVNGQGIDPEYGTPAQRKLMAERAAVVDGYRKLVERIAGILVTANSAAGANAISQDQVMVEARAYLRGAQVSTVTYNDGLATANVRVYIIPRAK